MNISIFIAKQEFGISFEMRFTFKLSVKSGAKVRQPPDLGLALK